MYFFIVNDYMKPTNTFCRIYLIAFESLDNANTLVLLLIVVNQYICITKPKALYDRLFRRMNIVFLIIGIYILVIVKAILMNTKFLQIFDSFYMECRNIGDINPRLIKVILGVTCIAIIILLYVSTIQYLRNSLKSKKTRRRGNTAIHKRYCLLVLTSMFTEYTPEIMITFVIKFNPVYWYLHPWVNILELISFVTHAYFFVYKVKSYVVAYNAFMKCRSPRQQRRESKRQTIIRNIQSEYKNRTNCFIKDLKGEEQDDIVKDIQPLELG
ncbi:unnamed protein product, partial [Owenia fusiformis]